MPAPRDPMLLLSILLEAASDPSTPASDKAIISDYLESNEALNAVVRAIEARQNTDTRLVDLVRALEPQVQARRAEKMLAALASSLPARITLRQAMAFVMIARGHYQRGPLTASRLHSESALDDNGQPVIGRSITNTWVTLERLVKRTGREGRDAPIRLSSKGEEVMRRAIERLRGHVY